MNDRAGRSTTIRYRSCNDDDKSAGNQHIGRFGGNECKFCLNSRFDEQEDWVSAFYTLW